jgi:hypothetical protein
MTYDETAGVFDRREDADWAMFCRGGRGEDEAEREPVAWSPTMKRSPGSSP